MPKQVAWQSRQHTTHRPTLGDLLTCDCGARAEEIAAGIHFEGCSNAEGEPDDPYDHYGQ